MAEPKPLASLSSSLLARKGQARPAMRPQGFAGFVNPMGGGHEDLGWNDMGHEIPRPVSLYADEHMNGFAPEIPEVVRQREVLAAEFSAPQDMELPHPVTEFASPDMPAIAPEQAIHPKAKPLTNEAPMVVRPLPTVAIARAKKAAKSRKTKAAFTLRMDPERHLKLRLACAISRESAQAIVTEALDNYLSRFPEIDELVRKVPAAV